MSARDEVDLAEVLRVVAEPAVRALLQRGELDSVALEWASVRIPGWTRQTPFGQGEGLEARVMTHEEFAQLPWDDVTRLVLCVQAKGETMTYEITDADETDDVDVEWHAEEFYGRLQDFIAESRFGWGQLRGAD